MRFRFHTILLIPTFIIIFVLEPNTFSDHFQSFCWNCPQMTLDWPARQFCCYALLFCPKQIPVSCKHCFSLHRTTSLLWERLSPERLLPPALLTLGSVTLIKQRIKFFLLQEVYIFFHFLKPAFPGPLPIPGVRDGVHNFFLSFLLYGSHHISGACGSSSVYPGVCMLFLSPDLIEDEICRAVVFVFHSYCCLRFAGERWKCWLLQPRLHKKPTLFISELFSICRCDDPNVKESLMI